MENLNGIGIIFSVQELEVIERVLKKNAGIITREDLVKLRDY